MRISDWSSDVCSSDLQASNTGQLYGSVSVRDIVDALAEDGVEGVTKAMVELERPIKSLGLFDVKVKLHPEVAFTVGVNVARSPDEAEMPKQGIDRSEERRVGKECVRRCRYRWCPYH